MWPGAKQVKEYSRTGDRQVISPGDAVLRAFPNRKQTSEEHQPAKQTTTSLQMGLNSAMNTIIDRSEDGNSSH